MICMIVCAGERPLAGQQVEIRGPSRVQIGPVIDPDAGELLRTHVERRAEDVPRLSQIGVGWAMTSSALARPKSVILT